MPTSMPVLFVAHGAPTLAVDQQAGADFRAWAAVLPRPKAVLVFSAHWETLGFAFGETTTHHKLIYDFGGFPEALYRIQYPAPGDPWLADEVESRLGMMERQINRSQRGLDHGVWVPMLHMWPEADVPVLQMTMPRVLSNADLYDLGRRLAPLRDDGIMIIGSGTLTHNLGEFRPDYNESPLAWAVDFDQWVASTLMQRDTEALLNWEQRAPHARQNHPTPEHFRPLLIALGAARVDEISFPVTGFEWGVFSRRCVQFG